MRPSSLSLALGASFVLLAAACGSTTSSGSSSTTTGTGGSTATGTGGSATTTTTGGGGGLGVGQCRSAMDCMGPDFCSIVVLPAFCGGQCSDTFDSDCVTDADCPSVGIICGKPCSCQQGGAVPAEHCAPGCATDADCGPSLACDATHRCVGKACSAPADCTANFACDAATSQCAPRLCTADAECGDRCVNGACAPFFGTCSPAVP